MVRSYMTKKLESDMIGLVWGIFYFLLVFILFIDSAWWVTGHAGSDADAWRLSTNKKKNNKKK